MITITILFFFLCILIDYNSVIAFIPPKQLIRNHSEHFLQSDGFHPAMIIIIIVEALLLSTVHTAVSETLLHLFASFAIFFFQLVTLCSILYGSLIMQLAHAAIRALYSSSWDG